MPELTFATQLEQSFKHLTLQITKNGQIVKTFTFPINPEELNHDEPARTNLTQTLGGAYTEEWGRGVMQMALRGTTGYRKRTYVDGRETDGFQTFKELRNDIYRYYLEPDGTPKQYSKGNDVYELQFLNWAESEFYVISPIKFSLQRSKSAPLLYRYDFPFYCLRPVTGVLSTNSNVRKEASTDPLGRKLSSFSTINSSAITALATSKSNIRALLNEDTLQGELNWGEVINDSNYPGVSAYFSRILKVVRFVESAIPSLQAYQNGSLNYVYGSMSDYTKQVTEVRSLCTSLSALNRKPMPLITELRELQHHLSLLATYTDYFSTGTGLRRVGL
jgi:hypothetical protein